MASDFLFARTSKPKHLVEFKAGRCFREGNSNTVKPENVKGLFYMDKSDDQLMHVYWKNRTNGRVEDNRIVFPRETEFFRVTQATGGRVFALKFQATSEVLFFWLQSANESKDEELVAKVRHYIDHPDQPFPPLTSRLADFRTGQGSTLEDMIRAVEARNASSSQDLPLMVNDNSPFISRTPPAEMQLDPPAPTTTTTTTTTSEIIAPPTASTGGNNQYHNQMSALRGLLSGIQVPQDQKPQMLEDVMTPAAIEPVLEDPELVQTLFPHLPAELSNNAENVREIIHSAPFKQALHTLSVALQTGQLMPLMSEMGLPPEAALGVKQFLAAILKKAHEERNMEQ